MAPVPPLIALMLGALGAALIVRHIVREWRRARDIERAEKAPVASATDGKAPTLRRGSDGIYRP